MITPAHTLVMAWLVRLAQAFSDPALAAAVLALQLSFPTPLLQLPLQDRPVA